MNEYLGGAHQDFGINEGSMVFSEKEIEVMMNVWAECVIGYNFKLNETNKFHQKHRKLNGLKLWEDMTLTERKNEFTKAIIKDLEITNNILSDGYKILGVEVIDYVVRRAYNPVDPMAGFYKCFLIKLGATITEDGQMKIPAGLNERLEAYLQNKRVVDLAVTQSLDQSLKQNPDNPKLKLKLKLE
jgi:hypothetical protein